MTVPKADQTCWTVGPCWTTPRALNRADTPSQHTYLSDLRFLPRRFASASRGPTVQQVQHLRTPGGGTPHPPPGPTYRHRTICVSPEWNPPGGTAAPSHEASAGWLRLLSPTVFPSPHRGLRGFLR
jgi:hypothetical protein